MRKRQKTTLDSAVVDLWDRELGQLSTRNFSHRFAASEDLVLRLDILRKLEKHRGCVNTLSFSTDGDILVSGSDDKKVILWSWESGSIKLSFHSGHTNNVFQAKIMPYTEDRHIVTCGADGQVRHAQVLERGNVETKLLGDHYGRAHKLAIEPGSPRIFYTCGEDGMVQHFDLRTGAATQLFTCQSQPSGSFTPTIHLNAITIDPRNPHLFAVAGSDEYTRLYDIRKYKWDASTTYGQPADHFCPPHLIGNEQVGITGLAFSDQSELLVSYNDEYIYLFTRDMGLGPNPAPASSASSDSMQSDTSREKSGLGPDPAPASPEMLSDASQEGSDGQSTCASDMDADPKSEVYKVGPQAYKGHRNSETVKGVNFFGPKCEYVVSGSDCGRIFIWKKKDGELIRVMEADKYVVNCIESHPHTTALASSGIENDVKVWTPIATHRATRPANIEQVLIFPLGGIFHRDYIYYESGSSDSNDDEDDDGDDSGDDDDDSGDDDDDDSDDDGDNDDDFGGGDGGDTSVDDDDDAFSYGEEEEDEDDDDDDLRDGFSCPNYGD